LNSAFWGENGPFERPVRTGVNIKNFDCRLNGPFERVVCIGLNVQLWYTARQSFYIYYGVGVTQLVDKVGQVGEITWSGRYQE